MITEFQMKFCKNNVIWANVILNPYCFVLCYCFYNHYYYPEFNIIRRI